MRFLKIKCLGTFNSYRQPDFHTYHKTLPLPPKTTIGGLIGSALGISPFEVNENWLLKDKFKMGIVGHSNGQANDLWQIRKYESKQIKAYDLGKESFPYKTAVIVREILYQNRVTLYLAFGEEKDYSIVKSAFNAPKWALSLGREDELIKIQSIEDIDISIKSGEAKYSNTVLPSDLINIEYTPLIDPVWSDNLLDKAPKSVTLPISFSMQKESEIRQGNEYRKFTYVHELPILVKEDAYFDTKDDVYFQIF